MIKIYQSDRNKNVGDTLTKPIIDYILGVSTQRVSINTENKLLGVGSIISYSARCGDTIWGSGLIENKEYQLPKKCKILALRGKLTQKILRTNCEIFGDPAILLPKIYNPTVNKQHKIGVVEHYIDKGLFKESAFKIDVQQHWKSFVEKIKSCEQILSSSLHGLIISESYGIPCKKIVLSNKVIGGDFKFEDYLSAFNRKNFNEPFDIDEYQNNLIDTLKNYYNNLFNE